METVPQFAARHGVSTKLVYRWAARGRIKIKKFGERTIMVDQKARPKPHRGGRGNKAA